jgi:hypothetical protein
LTFLPPRYGEFPGKYPVPEWLFIPQLGFDRVDTRSPPLLRNLFFGFSPQ